MTRIREEEEEYELWGQPSKIFHVEHAGYSSFKLDLSTKLMQLISVLKN